MQQAVNLKQEHIEERATAKSYSSGERYYRSGAVSKPTRQGNQIETRCQDSRASPYRVRIAFAEDGPVISATCGCPYDWGGDCKHVIAALLTHLLNCDRPDCNLLRRPT